MSFTQDLFTSRRNYADGSTRIGELGRLWYDPVTNTLRVSDGSTPGGIIVLGGGGGGGSGNFTYGPTAPANPTVGDRWLDSINMRMLVYINDGDSGQWIEVVNSSFLGILVLPTIVINAPTYVIGDNDQYVGVNYAGPVTITLPASTAVGRIIYIKDESGNCASYPITVTGTVDNDAGGFILAQNNGGIQLLYSNGWRIV
jgi:hypothetical protein